MSPSITKSLPRLYFWQSIAVVFGLITQVYLARILGPHDKGILDLFLLIPTVLSSTTDLGLLSANTFFAGKKKYTIHTLHSNTIVWTVLVVLFLIVGSVVWRYFGNIPFPSLDKKFLILSILATGPMLYLALWGGLMYGTDKAEAVYIIQGIGAVVLLMAYIGVIFFHAALAIAIYVTAAVIVLKALMAAILYFRNHPLSIVPDQIVFSASVKYGIALFVGIVINILHNRLVLFFVEGYLGPTALGLYTISVRIVEMIWLLDYVVINASLFKLTASSLDEAVILTTRMTRLIGCIVVAAGLGMAATIPWAIPLLLKKEFTPSVVPALLLLPGIISWSLGRSLAQFIVYQIGKPWYNTRIAAIAFTINIALSVLLIPHWGINGAALATTLSYMSMAVMMTFLFARTAHISVSAIYRIQKDDVALLKQSFEHLWYSFRREL
jgi:O-antigen/teichoic acid export membrane protein